LDKRFVAVGSANPVKVQAVKEALRYVWPSKHWSVIGLDADSGVSAQPIGDDQCRTGALNRAQSARAAPDVEFGVGIEGGVVQRHAQWYDVAWVVVLDDHGRQGMAASLLLPVPDAMMEHIHDGMELGHVDDLLFDEVNSKQHMGHHGVMTKRALSRTQVLRDATIAALVPFIHPEMFG
jgi:inosine/xanthosine triphosphatase